MLSTHCLPRSEGAVVWEGSSTGRQPTRGRLPERDSCGAGRQEPASVRRCSAAGLQGGSPYSHAHAPCCLPMLFAF